MRGSGFMPIVGIETGIVCDRWPRHLLLLASRPFFGVERGGGGRRRWTVDRTGPEIDRAGRISDACDMPLPRGGRHVSDRVVVFEDDILYETPGPHEQCVKSEQEGPANQNVRCPEVAWRRIDIPGNQCDQCPEKAEGIECQKTGASKPVDEATATLDQYPGWACSAHHIVPTARAWCSRSHPKTKRSARFTYASVP